MSRAREIKSRIIKNSKTEEQVSRRGVEGIKVEGKLKLEALISQLIDDKRKFWRHLWSMCNF